MSESLDRLMTDYTQTPWMQPEARAAEVSTGVVTVLVDGEMQQVAARVYLPSALARDHSADECRVMRTALEACCRMQVIVALEGLAARSDVQPYGDAHV